MSLSFTSIAVGYHSFIKHVNYVNSQLFYCKELTVDYQNYIILEGRFWMDKTYLPNWKKNAVEFALYRPIKN